MFDFDAGKLLIVGIIALIFIPPRDLPRVLRQAGQFVGKMRRMASEFQGQFMAAMREADMADLRREAQKLADSAKVDAGFDSVHDLKMHLTDAIEGKPVVPEPSGSMMNQSDQAGFDSGPRPLAVAPERAAAEAPRDRGESVDGGATPIPHSL